MTATGYTPAQRAVAVTWGLACHLAFAAGVGAMMVGLYTGMTLGRGPWHGWRAGLADSALVLQFVVLHSVMLAPRGRRWLARLAPLGLGEALGTTTYAFLASLQLVVTFVLWSPLGPVWVRPHGATVVVLTVAYAGAWLLVLKTMADAGLALQTGFLGWSAVARGRAPRYAAFAPRGTFRWVRQPIYVAFALTLWTAPVWTPDHLILALGWTAYCLLGPRLKERRYLAAHGDRYARYRRLVPYWIPSGRGLDPALLDAAEHPPPA